MSRSGIGPITFGIIERTAEDFNNPNLHLRDLLSNFSSRYEKFKGLLLDERSGERDR